MKPLLSEHHEQQLVARLEDALVNGYSHVTWAELYLWFGAKRLHKRFWQHLRDRWEQRCRYHGGDAVVLRIFETRGGLGLLGLPEDAVYVLPGVEPKSFKSLPYLTPAS
jgi:hypothetical protein